MEEYQHRIKNTSATSKIFSLNKRIRAVCGGTSASKTISILIWCIDYAQSNRGKLISIVSESFPHLSGGAMRDFEVIMRDRGYWKEDSYIKNPKPTYTFETGSQIEFLSVDSYGKAHGPRRDVLFINECNNLEFIIVDQLITRTRDIVWLDWNPSEEFWFYTEMLPKRNDVDFITLTYLDNEALDETTIQEIESHKDNKNWWTVYGLGQLGAIESRIYKNWNIIDQIPYEAQLERYGLDFGYSNDPTAIVAIYKYNGGYILDEITYQKGLSNKQIADIFNNLEKALVIADSAEPKSIDEIKSYGVNILPAEKGKDSVSNGIQAVQAVKVSATKRSINLIREYKNYLWKTDKDGKIINVPEDVWNHAMDALRYGIVSFRTQEPIRVSSYTPKFREFRGRF
jgi:phage terminase large subunit